MQNQEDFQVKLTLHKVSASLIADFAEKIAAPYYHGNLNEAIQDMLQKAVADQDFVHAHITHFRSPTEAEA